MNTRGITTTVGAIVLTAAALVVTVGSSTTAVAPAAAVGNTPPPAAAADRCSGAYTAPAVDALCWPLPVGAVVAVQGERRVWKLRGFAQRVGARLPGLDVRSVASCDQLPSAVCVTVVKERRRDVGWIGLTTWDLHPTTRSIVGATITLNAVFRTSPPATKRNVAAHEFMHVLGFDHHTGPGVIGTDPVLNGVPEPSTEEWALLHRWYG